MRLRGASSYDREEGIVDRKMMLSENGRLALLEQARQPVSNLLQFVSVLGYLGSIGLCEVLEVGYEISHFTNH
jgi:hypothetical protein